MTVFNNRIYIPSDIRYIMNRLLVSGFQAYVVGGAVRDSLMNVCPDDWDIFTDCDCLLDIFPEGKVIGGADRQAKCLTIIVDGVEVSQYRSSGNRLEVGGTIESHCNTCDLTINALAADKYGFVYDFVGGLDDMKNKVVRFVGIPSDRLMEDYIRLIRIYRFLAKYPDWEIDPVSDMAIYDSKPSRLGKMMIESNKPISVELFMKEFKKAMSTNKPSIFLDGLFRCGFLDHVLPEFKDAPNMVQNPEHHPEGDVWTHTLQVVDNCTPEYRIYAFFHDIGKMFSYQFSECKTHYKYRGHDEAGAQIMLEVGKRLKMSYKEIEISREVCRYHMEAYQAETDKSIRKLQARVKYLDILKEVCKADCMGRKDFNEKPFIPLPEKEVKEYVVNGKYLMDKGFKPGKELGDAKEACYEIQLEYGFTHPDEIFAIFCGEEIPSIQN